MGNCQLVEGDISVSDVQTIRTTLLSAVEIMVVRAENIEEKYSGGDAFNDRGPSNGNIRCPLPTIHILYKLF